PPRRICQKPLCDGRRKYSQFRRSTERVGDWQIRMVVVRGFGELPRCIAPQPPPYCAPRTKTDERCGTEDNEGENGVRSPSDCKTLLVERAADRSAHDCCHS